MWWGTPVLSPGHPAISVRLSLVPAPKAHNPPDMGSVQTAQRVCSTQVGPIPSQRRKTSRPQRTLKGYGGYKGRKREPGLFLQKRPKTGLKYWGGGLLWSEAGLTKEPFIQKPGGHEGRHD